MSIDMIVIAIENAKKQSQENGLDRIMMTIEFADKVVELLKEQQKEIDERTAEAVEPTLIREGRNKYYNDYVCPRCDDDVVYEQNYCSECGVKFMWESR